MSIRVRETTSFRALPLSLSLPEPAGAHVLVAAAEAHEEPDGKRLPDHEEHHLAEAEDAKEKAEKRPERVAHARERARNKGKERRQRIRQQHACHEVQLRATGGEGEREEPPTGVKRAR